MLLPSVIQESSGWICLEWWRKTFLNTYLIRASMSIWWKQQRSLLWHMDVFAGIIKPSPTYRQVLPHEQRAPTRAAKDISCFGKEQKLSKAKPPFASEIPSVIEHWHFLQSLSQLQEIRKRTSITARLRTPSLWCPNTQNSFGKSHKTPSLQLLIYGSFR